MKNYQQDILIILKRIFRIGKAFSAFVDSFGIDNIPNNESKDTFTDHIGGYSHSNSWCRTYNNGIISTEDEYGNLRFSNGEYATRTSDGYYYFSNGITGYEDSYGDIHLSNGQVIIKK